MLLALLAGCQDARCYPAPEHAQVVKRVALEGAAPAGALEALRAAAAGYGAELGQGGALVRWTALDAVALALATPPDLIEMNLAYDWADWDIETVLDHELGHLEGLGHTPDGIMSRVLERGEVRRICEER